MFDPTIGRWLTQDPEAFDAGDADLYRYCGNDPTNWVDPSGLDDLPVSRGTIRISAPGFTDSESSILMRTTRRAIEKIEKARIMLRDHWDELKELSLVEIPMAPPFTHKRYIKLSTVLTKPYGGFNVSGVLKVTVREIYLRRMADILDRIKDGSCDFEPDRKWTGPKGDTDAYVVDIVILWRTQISGQTIHLTQVFWGHPHQRQVDVLIREFGRTVGFSETGTGDLELDADEWDNTIDFLADKYDEMMRRNERMRPKNE